MKICKKCGGSIRGKEFNTYCDHDFGPTPPEPETAKVFLAAKNEEVWEAKSLYTLDGGSTEVKLQHPLKEQAVVDQKALWLDYHIGIELGRQRDAEEKARKEAQAPKIGQLWKDKKTGEVLLLGYLRKLGDRAGKWRTIAMDDNISVVGPEVYEHELHDRYTLVGSLIGRPGQVWESARYTTTLQLRLPVIERTGYGWMAERGDNGDTVIVPDDQLAAMTLSREPITHDVRRTKSGRPIPARTEALKRHASSGTLAYHAAMAKDPGERTREEWMLLATSSEPAGRKAVCNRLREMGWSSAEYMPLPAEDRVSAIMDGHSKKR